MTLKNIDLLYACKNLTRTCGVSLADRLVSKAIFDFLKIGTDKETDGIKVNPDGAATDPQLIFGSFEKIKSISVDTHSKSYIQCAKIKFILF